MDDLNTMHQFARLLDDVDLKSSPGMPESEMPLGWSWKKSPSIRDLWHLFDSDDSHRGDCSKQPLGMLWFWGAYSKGAATKAYSDEHLPDLETAQRQCVEAALGFEPNAT